MKSNSCKFALTACFLLSAQTAALAQAGALDASFDPGAGANDEIMAVGLQSDGRLIVGGNFTTFNNTNHNHIARLNADGSLDLSFNIGSGANGAVSTIWVLPDDRVVIKGGFTTFNGVSRAELARLNADGTLDTNYNANLNTSPTLFGDGVLAAAADGTIFGYTTNYNYGDGVTLWRRDATGALDGAYAGFSIRATQGGHGPPLGTLIGRIARDGKLLVNGDLNMRLHSIGVSDATYSAGNTNRGAMANALQNDGKLVVAGNFTNFAGQIRNRITRLNPNGSLDAAFDPAAGFSAAVMALSIQTDGRILCGGAFTNYNGTARQRIARLNTDATLEGTFDPGVGPNGQVDAMVVARDGSIVIAGTFTSVAGTSRNRIARLNGDPPSAAYLTTLSSNQSTAVGRNVALYANAGGAQPLSYQWQFNDAAIPGASDAVLDLKNLQLTNAGIYSVLISNSFGPLTSTGIVLTVDRAPVANGSVDAAAFTGTGADGIVRALVVRPNGKAIIGGYFKTVNGITRTKIAQFNTVGTVDAGFDTSAGPDNTVYALALQNDGKLLIGGTFSNVSGVARVSIARLDTNGAVDTSFNATLSPRVFGQPPVVNAIAIASDGRILVGGDFSAGAGSQYNGFVRLNSDGSVVNVVPTYASGTIVQSLLVRADGRWVVGFSAGSQSIIQYRTNFVTDFSYSGTSPVNAMAVQPDGRLLVAASGLAPYALIRLQTNGVRDTNFNSGYPTSNGGGLALALQANGRITLGGFKFQAFGATQTGLARVNSDGSPDPTFPITQGPDASVNALATLTNGAILAVGDFQSIDGCERHGIVRLNGDTAILGSAFTGNTFGVWVPTDAGKNYVLEFTDSATGGVWNACSMVSGNGTVQMLSDTGTNTATRLYRVKVE